MPDARGSDTRVQRGPAEPATTDRAAATPPRSTGRPVTWLTERAFPIGLVATLVPVWISAWRIASSGFYPTSDAALTVMRGRDLFSGDIPLVGMPAASGTFDGTMTYFPGPLQLWWLGIFEKLLGNVWGPPVAMAALSSVWIIAATWVLRRRFGPRVALAGAALLGIFIWSIGAGHLVDPVPVKMLIFPMVPFLLASWCAATGDRRALVVAAVIGNYLWLDHLVLVVVVPVVAVGVLAGYVWEHRSSWFDRSEQHRPERRRAWRGLGAAAAVSLVMWLPTIIAEVTRSPGNLRQLFQSSGHERAVVASWSYALHVVVDLITYPPFWLRGSLTDPPFYNMPRHRGLDGSSDVYAVVAGVTVVAFAVWLGLRARRRGDRASVWALIMAGVAVAGTVPTIYFTPITFGVAGYLRPMWGVAAFTWFALAFAAYRVLWRPARTQAVLGVLAVTLVIAVMNVPATRFGYVPNPRQTSTVNEMNRTVLPIVGDDPVALRTLPSYETHNYFGALMLALRTAGVDFCILEGSPPVAGVDDCDDRRRRVLKIEVVDARDFEGARSPDTIAAVPIFTDEERQRYHALEDRVNAWLADDRGVTLSDAGRRSLDASGPEALETVAVLLEPSQDPDTLQERRELLEMMVALWITVPSQRGVTPFADSPLTLDELVEWRELIIDYRYVLITETGVYPD